MEIVQFPGAAEPQPQPSRDEVLLEIRDRVRSLDPNANVRPGEFSAAFEEFLGEHLPTVRTDTYRFQYRILHRYFSGRLVHEITALDVRKFVLTRLNEGVTRGTVNRNRAALHTFFRWAVERQLAAVNPVAAVRKFKESPGRTRFLSREECERFLEAAKATRRGHFYPFVFMAMHTGARRGELLSLKWTDVDFTLNLINFRREKTKSAKSRIVPMVPGLVQVLQEWRETQRGFDGEQEFLFTYRGRRMKGINLSNFRRVCAKAGIEDKFRVHDLRHVFATSYMVNRGDLFRLQGLLGHSTTQMTMRYAHFSTDFIREAAVHIGLPGAPCTPAIPEVIEPAKAPQPRVVPQESIDVLHDLRAIFQERGTKFIPTRDLLVALASRRPEFNVPKHFGAMILARMLKPVGARPVQGGQHRGPNTKGYILGHLGPAFARYLKT